MELEDKDLSKEAAMIVAEIQPFVKFAAVSCVLDNTESSSYINITTKDEKEIVMCIRLSLSGYEIVGEAFDCTDVDPAKAYESIEQLLDSISPAYRKSFSDALINKLQYLEKAKLLESSDDAQTEPN